jgi:excisionase family DNA binding protein
VSTASKSAVQVLYTPMQIARLLGLPKSTVYDWLDSGALVFVRIGEKGKRYIPLAAIKRHGLVWESIKIAERARASA